MVGLNATDLATSSPVEYYHSADINAAGVASRQFITQAWCEFIAEATVDDHPKKHTVQQAVESARVIASGKALPVLVAVLADAQCFHVACANACNALSHLVRLAPGETRKFTSQIVQAALQTMRTFPDFQRVQAMASSLLGNLMAGHCEPRGSSRTQHSVFISSGADLILKALQAHPQSARVQGLGFHALWWLSYHVAAAKHMVRAGAIILGESALARFSADASMGVKIDTYVGGFLSQIKMCQRAMQMDGDL